jgi:hypothetical protein
MLLGGRYHRLCGQEIHLSGCSDLRGQLCGDLSGEHLLLKENVDMFDGGAVESDYAEYPVLLYANEIEVFSPMSQFLLEDNGFVLLRREDIS